VTQRAWRIVSIDDHDSYAHDLDQRVSEIVGVARPAIRPAFGDPANQRSLATWSDGGAARALAVTTAPPP
jgi:hypothetical protein